MNWMKRISGSERSARYGALLVPSLTALVIGGALLASPGSSETTEHASVSSDGPLYLAVGHSLSTGASSTPGHGFVDLLFADYQATLGVTGKTAYGLPGTAADIRTAGLTDALADINAPSDTRVVTVEIGGHEEWDCVFTSDANPCAFGPNYAAILAALRQALADDPGAERLIAIAYYNPAAGLGGLDEDHSDRGLLGTSKRLGCDDTGAEAGINDLIAQAAEANGALLADPYPAFKANGQAYMSEDRRHPNDAGYAAIARAFQSARPPCPPDIAAPETTIYSGPSAQTSDGAPTFLFFSTEPESTFRCKVDAALYAPCGSPNTVSPLPEGSHTFSVQATDPAGNTDASAASYGFTVDTTGPNTRIASGPSGRVATRKARFAFSSTEDASTFQCRLDSAGWSGCTSQKTYTRLPDTAHRFSVRATDRAGNTDATPAARRFTVDTRVAGVKVLVQEVQPQGHRVQVTVSARAKERVRATATGKIKLGQETLRLQPESTRIAADRRAILTLEAATRHDDRKVMQALEHHKKVEANVEVKLTDRVGNSAATKLVVRLK